MTGKSAGRKGGDIMWQLQEFFAEEDAVGVVEIILILVVVSTMNIEKA